MRKLRFHPWNGPSSTTTDVSVGGSAASSDGKPVRRCARRPPDRDEEDERPRRRIGTARCRDAVFRNALDGMPSFTARGVLSGNAGFRPCRPDDGPCSGRPRLGGAACHPELPTESGESCCVPSSAATGHACGPRAREWRQLLDTGEVKNVAELARRHGVPRARISQLMSLPPIGDQVPTLDELAETATGRAEGLKRRGPAELNRARETATLLSQILVLSDSAAYRVRADDKAMATLTQHAIHSAITLR